MSANFEQISGPGGRVQTLTVGSAVQTFLFNPASLKGTLPGGDYLYTDRFRARITGTLERTAAGAVPGPNWEALAQIGRGVRVYSPFLGEVVNKTMTSVPLLANHDAYFCNGFQQPTRARIMGAPTSSGAQLPIEFEFAINFARNYATRPGDFSPWLGFFEGGQIEIDLAPFNALAAYGYNMVGQWTCELVADWTPDRQTFIHAPVQSRLYKVITSGPEYTLKSVGSPNGMDGVVKGSRLMIMSWLSRGLGTAVDSFDNGFYSAFTNPATAGVLFGTAAGAPNITRIDVPFRDQRSIDAVSAWVSSFLHETAAIRHRETIFAGGVGPTGSQTDMAGWPYAQNPLLSLQQSLINSGLEFFPFVWPYAGQKIVDAQKVDGDLSLTVDMVEPPDDSLLNLFRTDEVCAMTKAKVLDLMERMGKKHVERGGDYMYVPKYAGLRAAGDSTQWGLPLKIVPVEKRK